MDSEIKKLAAFLIREYREEILSGEYDDGYRKDAEMWLESHESFDGISYDDPKRIAAYDKAARRVERACRRYEAMHSKLTEKILEEI